MGSCYVGHMLFQRPDNDACYEALLSGNARGEGKV